MAAAYKNGDPFLDVGKSAFQEIDDLEQAAELEQLDAARAEKLRELKLKEQGVILFIRECLGAGLAPEKVMKRFYARADLICPDLFAGLTLEERAQWFGEKKQTYCTRRKNVLRGHGLPDTGYAGMKGSVGNYKGKKPGAKAKPAHPAPKAA